MTSTQNTTSATLPRLRGRKPVNATTILGLVLVPFVIAGLFIWGLWNPTERLQDVTAAVVNLDEPVELDGQLVPLGRVLAGELIGGPKQASEQANFTWILTDEAEAEAGLKDGKYATIVTIPETFSAAATSMSGDADEVRQARIDITESDRGRLIDTALSGIVTQTATRVLNEQLGTQSVSALFGGMTELNKGIGGAADGAKKLADGNTQLATGVKGVADGTTELAAGTTELASGAGELADGTAQLATGATGLAQGMRTFTSGDGTAANPGLNGYAAGVQTLVRGNGGDNPGMVTYLNGVNDYATGVGDTLTAVRDPLAQLFAGLEGNVETLRATLNAINAGLIPLPPEVDKDQLVAALSAAITAIEDGSLDKALGGIDSLTEGSYLVAGGAQQYAGALPGIADGASALAAGSEQLTQGAEQLSAGVGGLSEGASALASGTNELASGTNELATGVTKLAEGSDASAKGTRELASGLREAADGIPNYTDDQAENLAKTAVTPVKAEGGSDEIFSGAGLPFFAGIALWAGALASFLVLAPLWSRTRDAARGIGWITLRSAGPAAAIGAAQGVIAGIVLPAALQYDFAQGAAFFCLAVLAGVAFALIVQGLSALLGGFGRFLAFALLVVGFVVGIVSTVPAGLAAVGDASPIGAAFSGFQAVAAGTGGAGLAAFLLVVWGLGGLVLTAFGVMRARAAHKK
ncbi:YhgE/Pip domain-containing protein [Leucobacter sp. cx-42]|uniref:YhgE/Pip domain-containing protein n=1 Tax=unclassified Leucobacter TaxID=2621730 RepID=UPI00165E44A2|nr:MULTISPECIES: YhgE/Pip domain-containing protein [unclassified Leucobacter]MBC9955314.1 YhgE/Pip domain-containing protein [Leucobacter sp. cx-42]